MLQRLEFIAVIIGLIASAFGAYKFLDMQHAKQAALLRTDLEIRQEILDNDINRNAKIRHHYDQVSAERQLSNAEQKRMKYIEEELERQYEDKAYLRQRSMEIE